MDPVLLKTIWGTNFRKSITSLFGLIAALGGAVVAVPPAWTALSLPEIATRGYVHQSVDPIKAAQTELRESNTKAINRLYRSQLELYKSQLVEALFRAQHDPTSATSETAQEHIRDLQDKINEVTSKINAQRND